MIVILRIRTITQNYSKVGHANLHNNYILWIRRIEGLKFENKKEARSLCEIFWIWGLHIEKIPYSTLQFFFFSHKYFIKDLTINCSQCIFVLCTYLVCLLLLYKNACHKWLKVNIQKWSSNELHLNENWTWEHEKWITSHFLSNSNFKKVKVSSTFIFFTLYHSHLTFLISFWWSSFVRKFLCI